MNALDSALGSDDSSRKSTVNNFLDGMRPEQEIALSRLFDVIEE
jgi:hypothetical protein